MPVPAISLTEARPARLARGMLLLLAALGSLAALALAGQAFWAENEFTQPETLIAHQAQNFRELGYLYYSFDEYPYMVSNYMPLTYGLGALVQSFGVTPIQAGRAVSLAALAWLVWLVWSLLRLYAPDDTRIAWLGAALCGCSVTLTGWGTVGQADLPAVAFTVAAFHEFSRHWLGRRSSLVRAGGFAVLGLFSKQTVLAVPAAIVIGLWLRHRRASLKFALLTAGAGLALLLAVDRCFDHRFLLNTVAANMNPFSGDKLRAQAGFWLSTCGGLVLIAGLGLPRLWRGAARPVLLWTGLALAVLALTAGKIGSDLNYQVEATVALIVTACLALYALGFFDLVFTDSKSPVPLLVMPLLVFAAVNLRVELATWIQRQGKELELRQQVARLAPRLPEAGRILSADMNVLQRLGRRIEVDPFMYRLLVQARRIAPERLTQDLAEGLFATVLLYGPANDRAEPDIEIPSLTRDQRAIVARRYRQVAHVPGPYAGGLYVYEPR